MNPTVSVIMTSVSRGNLNLLLVGSNVAKSLFSTRTLDLVRLFNRVDLPALVYPTIEMIGTLLLERRLRLSALDLAKRLMELGFHPPTVYFPLIVEEALMVEPTETESPQTLAALADAFVQVARESREAGNADDAKAAPRTTPVGRVDDVRAARKLVVTFDQRRPD